MLPASGSMTSPARRIGLAVLFPLILLTLAECVARITVDPPGRGRLFAKVTNPNGERAVQRNPGSNKKWYPPYTEKKGEGVIRIACVGGSTVEGMPIPEAAFPVVIQTMLAQLRSDSKVEVLGCGVGGQYSDNEVGALDEVIPLDPDVVVLYSAHNEFHPANVKALLARASRPAMSAVGRFVADLRLATAIGRWLGLDGKVQTNKSLKEEPPDHRPIDGPEFALVNERFRENLERFVARCEEREIAVVLCTAVSNVRDFAPMADVYGVGVAEADRERSKELVEKARESLKALEWQAALDSADAAIAIDPTPAGPHFWRGKALLGLRRIEESKRELVLARDTDGRVNRATTQLNAIVRDVAERTPALLADVEERFAAASTDGITGYDWILDNVHPSPEGQNLIARVVVEALGKANNIITPADLSRLPSLSRLTGQPSEADSEERIGFANLLLALEQGRFDDSAELARIHFTKALSIEQRPGALLGSALVDALEGKTDAAIAEMRRAYEADATVFAGYAESAKKSKFVESLFRSCGVVYENGEAVLASPGRR